MRSHAGTSQNALSDGYEQMPLERAATQLAERFVEAKPSMQKPRRIYSVASPGHPRVEGLILAFRLDPRS
jgi:hypothetical protein